MKFIRRRGEVEFLSKNSSISRPNSESQTKGSFNRPELGW